MKSGKIFYYSIMLSLPPFFCAPTAITINILKITIIVNIPPQPLLCHHTIVTSIIVVTTTNTSSATPSLPPPKLPLSLPLCLHGLYIYIYIYIYITNETYVYQKLKYNFHSSPSDSWIRDLEFNSRLHQKLIGILVWW